MIEGLRIGQVAQRVGLRMRAIRYYEQIRLIPRAERNSIAPSGYRLFRESDVRRLEFIRDARKLGLSLKQIRNLLSLSLIHI